MNHRVFAGIAVTVLAGGALVAYVNLPDPEETISAGAARAADARQAVRSSRAPGTPPVVPALVRRITDPSLHRLERAEAIRELPEDLSRDELAALADLFRQSPPADMAPATWYVVLNELMTVLGEARFAWSEFGTVMSGLMTDRHVDPVVRDYAAQYLATWLRGEAGRGIPAAERTEMLRGYLKVLDGGREAFEPVFGTSLMMLCDLRDNRGEDALAPVRAELEPVIAGYVDGTVSASLANRISAIQAAGRIGVTAALPKIRGLARDAGTDPSLRLSSVAALGYFAEDEDRDFLEQLAESGSRLRFAAHQALTNFDQ